MAGQSTRQQEGLRISDADREQAASDLSEHYAEGRLSHDEHAERPDERERRDGEEQQRARRLATLEQRQNRRRSFGRQWLVSVQAVGCRHFRPHSQRRSR